MSFPFSPPARAAIARAEQLAVAQKSGVVSETHLFLALLEEPTEVVTTLLALSGIAREAAQLYAENALEAVPLQPGKPLKLSVGAQKTLHQAAVHAQSEGVTPEPHHLFIACLSPRRGPHLGETLGPMGLDAAKLRGHLRGMKARQTARTSQLKLTARAEKAVEAAQGEMRASFCGRISTAHLLLGLVSDRDNIAVEALQKAGCDGEELRKRARQSIKSDGEIAMPQQRFSPGAKRALERAEKAAIASRHRFIDCGDLLMGLLPQSETLGERWRARGRQLDSVEGLWTLEQVAALRAESENVTNKDNTAVVANEAHRDFRLTTSDPKVSSAIERTFLGIISGIASAYTLSLTTQRNQLPDFSALLTWLTLAPVGIALGAALLKRRSGRLLNVSVAACLWILGMAVGFYLFY